MAEEEAYRELIKKYTEGTASPEEIALLESRYIQWNKNKERVHTKEMLSASEQIMWSKIRSRVNMDKAVRQRTLWPRIAIAAALATIIFGAGLFYYRSDNKNDRASTYANDIAPGKNGATLTLANGQKILINDALAGNIATQSGVKISKTEDGQIVYELTDSGSGELAYNTLSTTRGEQTQVRLPDGTLVFLNAASSLKYPVSFAKLDKRKVELAGEGYFQVAKDKKHPFVVESRGQEVEVLGTHFNINAYHEEPAVATSLIEGSVKVTAGGEPRVLRPGEQGLTDGGAVKVVKANMDNVIDWKDGDFNLNDTDFKTAMRKLSRWYDIEVVYDKSVPDDIESGGWISRNSKLSSVLKLIENSGLVKFRIEGKKVYVYR